MTSCAFKDCHHKAIPNSDKCNAHKFRKQCRIPDCYNIVYARHLCVRHGGKKKCKASGCAANAYGGNFCGQHGGSLSKPACKFEGCKKQSHTRGLCVTHGGGRRCHIEGCGHYARGGGLCHKHKTLSDQHQTKPTQTIKEEVNFRFEPIYKDEYHHTGRYEAAYKDDMSHHEFLELLLQYFPINGDEPRKTMFPAVRSPCSVDTFVFI